MWDILLKKLKSVSSRSTTKADDMVIEIVQTTNKTTIALLALLIGMHYLELTDKWGIRLNHLVFVIAGIQIAAWLSKGITIWYRERIVHVDSALTN